MARRSGPTLYEAMSKSAATGSAPTPVGRRPHPTETDRPATPVLLTPGSMVRLPVGYVWVLLIVGVVAVVASYLIGHGRGVTDGRVEMEQTLVAQDRLSQETARIREPGLASEADVSAPVTPAAPVRRPDPAVSRTRDDLPPPPPGGPVLVPGVDPPSVLVERRTSGKSYYQLITIRRDDAVDLAVVVRDAVRDLGLDVQVVSGDNPGLASVMLLPGFDGRSMTDEERRNWADRMRILRSRVAGKFKFTGEQPFADAFPVRHP